MVLAGGTDFVGKYLKAKFKELGYEVKNILYRGIVLKKNEKTYIYFFAFSIRNI